MIIRRLFSLTLLLIFLLSNAGAEYILKNSEGSLIAQMKGNRVKRAWKYPDITIAEQFEGAPFQPKVIAEIASDNSNVVKYELLSGTPGVDDGYFAMENSQGKGVIRQIRAIDRETFSKFTIYARALDKNNEPAESPDANLDIIIRDENDNSPVFVPSSLTGSVLESASVGTLVGELKATDADSSENDNNKVRFDHFGSESPASTDGANRFAVNEAGQVSVVSSLDKESESTITFVVRARDGFDLPNVPRLSATATYTVQILDDNDNAPYFSEDVYSQSVGELASVGSTLISVEANDVDEGVNKGVYFRISGGDSNGQFSIQSRPDFENGPSYGDLILEKPLDYENGEQSYSLTITAYNQDGLNNVETMTSTATIQLTVTDENEPPVFLNEPYTGTVAENVDVEVPKIAKVTAEDYDFEGIQTVSYSLVNPLGWFSIEQDGYISAVAPVDREHVSVDDATSQYLLYVTAKDNAGTPDLTSTATVTITIGDKNDNAPDKGSGWAPTICEDPSSSVRSNTSILQVVDHDSDLFAPFSFTKLESDDWNPFDFEIGVTREFVRLVITTQGTFDASSKDMYQLPIRVVDTAANDQPAQTSTLTVSVSICSCNENYELLCNVIGPVAAGFPPVAIIAIVVAILILLILVLAVVAYRRRNKSELEKQALFYDEDDIRENLQPYHEEGGEEDNDGYDISALQAPPLTAPKRHDMTPLGTDAVPQPRSRVPPDTDIGDYINDAKQQADSDPTAPPFDSILVFDYEGQESDAGSLSSLNSGTTDASQDYDYLQDWGPRFKKLADMYGGGEED